MALRPSDVGHRVVVRMVVRPDVGAAAGARVDGRPTFRDLLGELVRLDPVRRAVVVRTAAGVEETVPVTDIAAAKRVPPARPDRRPGRAG